MRIRVAIVSAAAALGLSALLVASGPVGIYGIVERVVFEPDEAHAERIQVWGAFSFVDCCGTSRVERGYLYFRLPQAGGAEDPDQTSLVRREWADLKAVGGTGQAVGFGSWRYVGAAATVPERAAAGGVLRVRPASEKPSSPAPYQMDSGLVKISANGNHSDIVKQMQEALRK